MTSLGFENYAEALKIYLSKYREVSLFWFRCILPRIGTLRTTACSHLRQQQSQSNRSEGQQNRPNSQGYGAAGGSNQAGGFPGGELGPQEGGDAQGYLYSGQGGHNGASADY